MNRLLIPAAALALLGGLGLAACGSGGTTSTTPRATATRTTAPASPELTADKALCKVWTANIGSNDLAISQAETGAESPKLVTDINKALAAPTMQSGLDAQVQVTLDCTLAAYGKTP